MVGGVRETVEIQGFYEKMGMRKSVDKVKVFRDKRSVFGDKVKVFGDKVRVEIELVKVI